MCKFIFPANENHGHHILSTVNFIPTRKFYKDFNTITVNIYIIITWFAVIIKCRILIMALCHGI